MSPLLAKRLSDENLGSRLASGEAAAFDELYRRYVHRLAAYGAQLLGDGAAGDDVAQATMLKAYGALRGGRVPDRMKPWLYRIAHNVAIDLAVRRREVPAAELPELGTSDSEPVGGALVAALATLPERQRRVYVLRELHGLRIAETAAELSLTAAQVEQSLFAARNRLAEHLVFGDRLNCVAVQRLAAGPLDADERRALKNHLRSCAGCRDGLGVRGRALSVLPVTSLEWLRGLVAGGGAPVVAKVGAAVATVTVAAGVPASVETAQHFHAARLPQSGHLVSKHRVRPARLVAAPAAFRATSHRVFVAQRISAPVPAAKTRGDGNERADTSGVSSDSHEGHGGGGDTPAAISSSDGSRSGQGETDEGKASTVLTVTTSSSDTSRSGDGTDGRDSGGHDGDSDSLSGGGGHDGGGDSGGDGDLPPPADRPNVSD